MTRTVTYKPNVDPLMDLKREKIKKARSCYCGRTPQVWETKGGPGLEPYTQQYRILCMEIPDHFSAGPWGDTLDDAVAEWNKTL